MSTPAECREKLDSYAVELDKRSKELADTARLLEPVELLYSEFIEDYETGMAEDYAAAEERLPAEAIRMRMTMRAMRQQQADLFSEHASLTARRKRLERRIKDLSVLVDAQRSILSALKSELEAAG